jgi:hypothetical protein
MFAKKVRANAVVVCSKEIDCRASKTENTSQQSSRSDHEKSRS